MTDHTGGNAEDCPLCRPQIDKTVLYPWICPGQPEAAAPATEERHTADTITDDALDALYERLEAAEERASTYQAAWHSARDRARKAERAANLLADSHRRAERAEAALAGVRNAAHLHRQGLLSPAELHAVIGPAALDPQQ